MRPTTLLVVAALAHGAALGGCTGTVGAADDAGGGIDAARADAGSAPDAFSPGTDGGPGVDAFVDPGLDAGVGVDAFVDPGVDAFVPAVDAFVPAVDAFVPPVDGGPVVPPTLAGCRVFPSDNPWNTDISGYPRHARHAQILAMMSPTRALHPDWGNWSTDHYGIPWVTGTGAPPLPITWTASWGPTESDPLMCPTGTGRFCYPIPGTAPIEGGPSAPSGADRHVLYVDVAGAPDHCTLYELYNAQNFSGGGWTAQNGAIFPLGTNALRPDGWTSADAAGLPVLPGLVRVEEVLAGEIRHAIRFTMSRTARAYVHPATHQAGRAGTDLPPMGLRLRLRGDYDVSGAAPSSQVILRAMQRYGLILADNGSDWYLTGDSDDRWDAIIDDVLADLGAVHGSDFEIVETGAFQM